MKLGGEKRIPVSRTDDGELLGFMVYDGTSWSAQMIFGYTIERVDSREAAEKILRERGLSFLMGVWQYYDEEDQDWFPCVLKEAYEHQVNVLRTTPLGYQDPEDYKVVTIVDPTEEKLVKG